MVVFCFICCEAFDEAKIKGIIAGGFALSIYTGNLNINSDIDIFIPFNFEETMDDILNTDNFLGYLKLFGYNQSLKEINRYEKTVLTFENKLIKRKIQIVIAKQCHKNSNFPHIIINNFDLTICMCFIKLHGKNKYEYYSEHMNHTFIH